MEFALGLVYLLVTGAVLVCMAVLLLKGERTVSTWIYLFCQGTVALWCASQVLVLLAGDGAELTAAYLIGNLGICFIGSGWFCFVLSYCGKSLAGARWILPCAASVFHYGAVVTNPLHHLYYPVFTLEEVSHGVFFYTNVACTYFLVLLGVVILYRGVREDRTQARRLVAASVLAPVVLNAVCLTGIVRTSFDITPLGFAISAVLVMLATTKYRFINFRRELAIAEERLLLEQERNRIAQQVHDTAGHTLTMIQSYVKLAEISAGENRYEEGKGYLGEARSLAAKGIRELRESINVLRQGAEYELVTQGVMQLAGQVKEIPVEVTVKGEDGGRYSHLSKVIYDTVRESVTNTLKYAGASRMDVVLRFQDSLVEVLIGDDGAGCERVEENNGIRGIRERIAGAGGTVRFSTAPGEGFLTCVRLPVGSRRAADRIADWRRTWKKDRRWKK